MKKLLSTLSIIIAFATAAMADATYVINASTAPVGSGSLETMGITIKPSTGSATFASGKNGTIKFSRGREYTVTLPAQAKITKVAFYGYGNEDGNDTYLKELGGTTYGATDHLFRTRTTLTAEPYDTHVIDCTTPLTGKFTFTFDGAQACMTITLTSAEEEPQEPTDEFSLGKYSNPATGGVTPTGAKHTFTYPTPASQMERLDRGVVVLPEMNGKGNVITWRLFGTDGLGKSSATTFDVLRNGHVIAADLATVTNYTDAEGTREDKYSVRTKVNGEITETSAEVEPWNRIYKTLRLDRPSDIYSANDMSVGDVDGDGQYELIVKWYPKDAKDNSQSGITSAVMIDAYRLDGTKLWRIDLGRNIRAGAHYTQIIVYDLDGDGKAEVVCKTAPGSKDSKGNFVSAAATDAAIVNVENTKNYFNSSGHITGGQEFLTVFNGESGEAMHTIWYNPPRSGIVGDTGATTYGKWESVISKSTNYNRGERYNAAVAYLNGANALPSAILQRGYYTYTFIWAVDWDGKALSTRWVHYGDSPSSWKTFDASLKEVASGSGKSSFGQGVHAISIGDVDGDGCDEVVIGAATINNDGSLLCSTGKGHGDAIHLADLDPDREGLEVMMPHEESPYGYDVHDAATGELIVSATSSGDNGRGLAADVLADNRGYEFWSSASSNVMSAATGTVLGSKRPSTNFRIYWDGDLQDELFDGHFSGSNATCDFDGTCAAAIEKLTNASTFSTLLSLSNEAYGNAHSNNTTKGTPSLVADILGDWREELILWDSKDPAVINIYSSNVPSTYRVPTLMHDHVYRMGIVWQNSSYNQPPHLGYYLPDMFDRNHGIYSDDFANGITEIYASPRANIIYNLSGQRISTPLPGQITITNGHKHLAK